jgi:hypothetical protein
MRGIIPPLPQQVFTAWYLVKHRDNFTFYLYSLQLFLEAENNVENTQQIKPSPADV